jgi:hypothetical protein
VNPRPSIVKPVFAWALLFLTTLLLISFGGAIVAAPVTIPLLLLAVRASPSKGYRVWAGVVVVLTMAEVAWALTYFAVGEAKPAIWLVPTLAALGVIVGYVRLARPRVV